MMMDGNTITTMMSSAKADYETPDDIFKTLDKIFNFDLDVCATKDNTKVPRNFITPEQDAFNVDWHGSRFWMNPPYGRGIDKWVQKAADSCEANTIGVCLLPVRTDTAWFQIVFDEATIVLFLRGRIRFKNADSTAPFPSIVACFGNYHNVDSYVADLSALGNVVHTKTGIYPYEKSIL